MGGVHDRSRSPHRLRAKTLEQGSADRGDAFEPPAMLEDRDAGRAAIEAAALALEPVRRALGFREPVLRGASQHDADRGRERDPVAGRHVDDLAALPVRSAAPIVSRSRITTIAARAT